MGANVPWTREEGPVLRVLEGHRARMEDPPGCVARDRPHGRSEPRLCPSSLLETEGSASPGAARVELQPPHVLIPVMIRMYSQLLGCIPPVEVACPCRTRPYARRA